jgi:hypothetical protein
MVNLFDPAVIKHLESLGEANAERYRTNHPFPHIVIDDFLPPELLEDVLANFPNPKANLEWTRFNSEEEKKLAFPVADQMPGPVRDMLYFLNSKPALEFLEKLTGVDALLPDPYYSGGGIHQIEPGGYLGVHADFNKYERFGLDRRLNLLLYLNKDWKEEYGGHLELWSRDMSRCVHKVLPVFNRCVVFSTDSSSYHGHPTPLTCPPDRTRRSMATYYYTNGRPAEEQNESHSTLWQRRPGEAMDPARMAKKIIRSLAPPVVADAVRFVKKRMGSDS